MRCADREHRTLRNTVGGNCIGQPGNVAALVVSRFTSAGRSM